MNNIRPIFYNQAQKEISGGKINPCYIFYGEEFYLAENLVKQITAKFLGQVDTELNFFTRYATEVGADVILTLGSGMGLFCDKKIIYVKETQAFKQAEIDKLFKFLQKQPPEICMIFQTSETSLNKIQLKKLQPFAVSVNLLPLRQQELTQFISSEFGKYQKQISNDAISLLIFHIGSRISDLITQVNMIVQYYSDKTTIDVEEIEKITSTYVTQTIFEYCKFVGNKSLKESVLILHKLVDSGIAAQQIISQLLWHFLKLWQIQGYYRSGIRNSDRIARELSIFPKYFPEYATQAKKWHTKELIATIEHLQKADIDSKSTQSNTKIDLDILNFKILN